MDDDEVDGRGSGEEKETSFHIGKKRERKDIVRKHGLIIGIQLIRQS